MSTPYALGGIGQPPLTLPSTILVRHSVPITVDCCLVMMFTTDGKTLSMIMLAIILSIYLTCGTLTLLFFIMLPLRSCYNSDATCNLLFNLRSAHNNFYKFIICTYHCRPCNKKSVCTCDTSRYYSCLCWG